jgi:hypothetical protein
MNTHRTAARIVGVLSSVTLTLLIVGSQIGLADHYTSIVDAEIAMQRSVLVTQAASAPAALRAMS